MTSLTSLTSLKLNWKVRQVLVIFTWPDCLKFANKKRPPGRWGSFEAQQKDRKERDRLGSRCLEILERLVSFNWYLFILFHVFLSKLTGKVVFHSFISCLTYSFGHVWRCLKQLSWPRNTKSTSINGWKAARIRTCHTEAQETHETRNGASKLSKLKKNRRLPGAETQKASKSLAALASRSWDFSLTLRRCKQWEIDCVGICGFMEAFPAQNKSTWQGQNLCFRSFTFGHSTTSIHALKTS